MTQPPPGSEFRRSLGGDERQEENDRVTRALAGLAVVLFLAVVSLFLVQKIRAVSEIQDCIMQGRTNCEPINPATLNEP